MAQVWHLGMLQSPLVIVQNVKIERIRRKEEEGEGKEEGV